MKVRCEKCQAEYNIDESRIPAEGLQIKCPRCASSFVVHKGTAPQTTGQIFEFGEVQMAPPSGANDSLELDLPGRPPAAPAKNRQMPPLPRPESGSTLPPIPSKAAFAAGPPNTVSAKGGGAFGSSLPEMPPVENKVSSAGASKELLDFVEHDIGDAADDGGEDRGTVHEARFRIRRKSGKIFGPFDVPTVKRMLNEHQLIGNEEASADGHLFKPLGSFEQFADTIRSLMDEPVSSGAASAKASAASENPEEDMEGDLLAPSGVEFAEPAARAPRTLRLSLPVILGLSVLLLLLLAGVSLGLFTKYGFFGIRLISGESSQESSGSLGGVTSNNAAVSETVLVNFFQDTFTGYRAVVEELETVLKGGGSVPSYYILGLSYAALLRNYGANEAYLKRLREVIEVLKGQNSSSPESGKVQAALLMLSDPDGTLVLLKPLLGEDAKDKEALFLAGWATAYQKKWAEAAAYFDRALVLDPDYAKSYHALGEIQSLQGDFENAAVFYQKALDKNPRHINSALEIARILIEAKGQDAEGDAILTQVFGKHFQELAPNEQAKAHFLRAQLQMHRQEKEKAQQDLSTAIQLAPSRTDYVAALGNYLLDLGDNAKALSLFEQILSAHPKNVDALVGKGRALWLNGELIKAKMLLEETAAAAKDDSRPLYFIGRVNEDLGKLPEAMNMYQEATKLTPDFLLAKVAMARLQIKQGQVKEALERLSDAVKNHPRSAIVHNGLGEVYLTQKNLRLAEEEFATALQLDPQLVSAHFNLANTFREKGEFDRANAEYEKVNTLAPTYPDLILEYGFSLFQGQKFPEALKMYEKAILASPKDDRLYVRAGLAADSAGDLKTAIKYFQSATALNSQNSEAFFHLGLVFQRQNEHEQALELFKKATGLDKGNAEIHFAMGKSLLAGEAVADALEEFRATVKIKPDHIEALMAMGQALAAHSQLDEAIRSFEKVIKVRAKDVELLLALGDLYLKKGQFPKALAMFTQASRIAPNAKGVSYQIGRAYDEMSKRPLAIQFYQKAIKADAKDPLPHFYLGHIYKATGKTKWAVAEFRKYLELRPDAPDADDVREEIEYLQ